MPVYEYECLSCGKIHEITQRFGDDPLIDCPDCKGAVRKLISRTSFVLKGSGWYKTDYATNNNGKKTDLPVRGTQTEGSNNGSKNNNEAKTASQDKT